MKRSKLGESQIAYLLNQAETGEVDPISGTTGRGSLVGSAAAPVFRLRHAMNLSGCCCGCGDVGNAPALSKLVRGTSVISTADAPSAPVTPSRRTAIGVRSPSA